MKQLMIFDLDGTIGDTVASLAYSVNKVLEQLGLPTQPEENFNHYAGDGARNMIARALKDSGDKNGEYLDEAMELYPTIFETGCLVGVKSFPGLPETLNKLKDYGMLLAVCTNKAQHFAESVVAEIYGEGFFDYILGEQPDIPRKPAPDGPLLIMEELGVSPEECVYVGDTDTDMQTGINAKMYTVGVTWGFRDREELSENGADLIIDEPEELLELAL